jgi:hypothetical protein
MIVGGNGSGLPVAGIGALLGLQATRVRFEFDDEAMEVKLDSGGDKLADSGENFAVGGKVRTVPFLQQISCICVTVNNLLSTACCRYTSVAAL